MRAPNFELDGWCLEDGEERHRSAPATFEIPELVDRQSLRRGDFAQLIFKIAIDDDEDPESIERMWVIVRERTREGYIGMLNNRPATIPENDDLWVGTELPFEARHIITVRPGNSESLSLANGPAPIPWSR